MCIGEGNIEINPYFFLGLENKIKSFLNQSSIWNKDVRVRLLRGLANSTSNPIKLCD
jgi:hypothetical protein